MTQKVFRNVAIVTAIFMLALTTMLTVSYVQMQRVSPLNTEVMETLKQANETQTDNAALQQQIRELDLLSRKAYFVHEHQLKTGVYILIGMAIVLLVCLNLYYKETKNLPGKELDPIDEWLNKSKARRYVNTLGVLLLLCGIGYLVLSKMDFSKSGAEEVPEEVETELGAEPDAEPTDTLAVEEADSLQADTQAGDSLVEAFDSLPPLKIAHNGFRGNNASGTSSARGIPTSWDLKTGKNILWKVAIPKHGYNSPVINGRSVFITGADASARELYCYDVYTGELKWTAKADNISGSPSSMPKTTADTGLAASTVATNGKQVVAIFATGDVLCTDMEGKRLWAKNLGVPDNHYGYASSPVISGGKVIIQYQNNSNAKIMALSLSNGAQSWSISPKGKIAWSSPVVATLGGKSAVVVSGNPAVAAYSLSNGSELWRVECMSGEVGASPVVNNGTVYAASEYAKCVAIDGATGEVKWEASDYLPECSSPAATKDLVFVATSYGVVCAYSTETGEIVKEHDLSTPFYSSPMVADGKVWLFSNSGTVNIFSSSNFNKITSFNTGEKTFATPAFSDNMMVVRADKTLYCVKKTDK